MKVSFRSKLLFVFLWAVICGVATSSIGQEKASLRMIATNSIVADLVKNVAGYDLDLTVLVGANADPHTYEPTPQDNIRLAKATLIFENGQYLEPWMDKLYKASRSQATRVRVTDQVPLIPGGHAHEYAAQDDHSQDGEMHDDHAEHEDHAVSLEDEHEEYDPHVWHDPYNVKQMVQNIRDALIAPDPVHKAIYAQRAKEYTDQLTELDLWIQKTLVSLPEEKRQLVTSHDTFGYFARRYGFKVIGAVINAATTEAADPSSAQIVQLVKDIKASGVSAIFIENVTNPQMVNTVAREAKVKVAKALYSDALGDDSSGASTYIDMMKYNVTAIIEALL